jgi:hypothetical protein
MGSGQLQRHLAAGSPRKELPREVKTVRTASVWTQDAFATLWDTAWTLQRSYSLLLSLADISRTHSLAMGHAGDLRGAQMDVGLPARIRRGAGEGRREMADAPVIGTVGPLEVGTIRRMPCVRPRFVWERNGWAA